MESSLFFSMLLERLTYLGLDEESARREISAFRQKIKTNPRFDLLVAQAGEETVNKTAERLYAGVIVRANSAIRGRTVGGEDKDVTAYTDEIETSAESEFNEAKTLDTLQRIDVPTGENMDDAYEDDAQDPNEKPDYVSILSGKLKDSFERNPASKLLLVLIIPLTAILLLAVNAVFCGMFLVLIALSVFFLALTAAVAVGGTGISLAGLIYGSIKFFTGNAPVGLFEIGIGVTVIGMTIFAAIVFYNCAVRFLPIVIKLTGKLLKSFFSYLADNIKTVKGVFSER